jgi:hypothetical protein
MILLDVLAEGESKENLQTCKLGRGWYRKGADGLKLVGEYNAHPRA